MLSMCPRRHNYWDDRSAAKDGDLALHLQDRRPSVWGDLRTPAAQALTINSQHGGTSPTSNRGTKLIVIATNTSFR